MPALAATGVVSQDTAEDVEESEYSDNGGTPGESAYIRIMRTIRNSRERSARNVPSAGTLNDYEELPDLRIEDEDVPLPNHFVCPPTYQEMMTLVQKFRAARNELLAPFQLNGPIPIGLGSSSIVPAEAVPVTPTPAQRSSINHFDLYREAAAQSSSTTRSYASITAQRVRESVIQQSE